MGLVGYPIFLRLWLEDGDETKYVRAVVRNDQGVEVSGSPAVLSSVGEGLYINNSSVLFPPVTNFLTATYLVYDDPGFTIQSEEYYNGGDDVFETTLYDTLNQVGQLFFTPIGDVVGEIDDMTCVIGEIVSEELFVGEIIPDEYLTGEIIDEVLEGFIEDCSGGV